MSILSSKLALKGRLNSACRRRVILETTLAVLAQHGAEGASLRLVCREMDVSPSLLTHFFAGWHELLYATNDMAVNRFLGALREVGAANFSTERFRMDEFLRRYLATDWLGRTTVGALLALWQMSRSIPRLQSAYDCFLAERRVILQTCMENLARLSTRPVDVNEVTISFMLMLDGIWLNMSQAAMPLSDCYEIQTCWFWLAARFGRPDWELVCNDVPCRAHGVH